MAQDNYRKLRRNFFQRKWRKKRLRKEKTIIFALAKENREAP